MSRIYFMGEPVGSRGMEEMLGDSNPMEAEEESRGDIGHLLCQLLAELKKIGARLAPQEEEHGYDPDFDYSSEVLANEGE